MSDEVELVWEELASTREGQRWYSETWETHRAKVPGGWLVLVRLTGRVAGTPTITFYPDPRHDWDGGSLP